MQVTIQSIPTSFQEFEMLAAKGRQPEHICALFLCALALFDRDKDAGVAAMNLLRGPKPMTLYGRYAWEWIPAASAIYTECAGRPQTAGYRAWLSACISQNGRCRLTAPDEAAAESLDRRMVFVGVFEHFERYSHPGSRRSMGITRLRKGVHKNGTN